MTDADVREQLTAADAVGWMRDAVRLHHAGLLEAPLRVHAELGDGRLVSLGAVLAGEVPGRVGPDDITLFCSVGLAGTEAYLLAQPLDPPPATPHTPPAQRSPRRPFPDPPGTAPHSGSLRR